MQIENKVKYWIQLEYVHDHQLFIKYQLFMGLIIFSETLHIDTNVKRYKMNDIQSFWRAIHALINCDLDFFLTNQISKASENTYCQLGNNQSIYLSFPSLLPSLCWMFLIHYSFCIFWHWSWTYSNCIQYLPLFSICMT